MGDNHHEPFTEPPDVELEYIRCPQCKYRLMGLPLAGKCPECGNSYIVTGQPTETELIDIFNDALPRHVRWACKVRPGHQIRLRSGLVRWIVLTILITSAYIGMQIGAIALAFFIAPEEARLRGTTALVEFCWYWNPPFRIQEEGVATAIIAILVGQLLLSIFVFLAFAAQAYRSPFYRRPIIRFGAFAASAVPASLVLPAVALATWNILNTWFVHRGSAVVDILALLPWKRRHDYHEIDALYLIGFVGLMITSLIAARAILRTAKRTKSLLRDAVLGVRRE